MTRILIFGYYLTAHSIQRVLQSGGYECLVPQRGNLNPQGHEQGLEYEKQALEILRTRTIDLFIHDLNRFGTRGYLWGGVEFLQKRKCDKFLSEIPVLTVSAAAPQLIVELLQGVGLDVESDLGDFLSVPLCPIELLDVVESILRRHGKSIPPQAETARAKLYEKQRDRERRMLAGPPSKQTPHKKKTATSSPRRRR